MDKVLFTAGYGNNAPDEFLARLKAAGVTVVLDVRRKGSESWCGAYRWGNAMAGLLYGDNSNEGPDIAYGKWHCLANHYETLAAYKNWLESSLTSTRSARGFLSELQYWVAKKEADTFCLVCSELHAYKDGEVNCHRLYLADALVERLGEGWSAVHL